MVGDKSFLLCEWGTDGAVVADVRVGGTLSIRELVQIDAQAIAEAGDLVTALGGLVERHGWRDRKTIVLSVGGRSEHHVIDSPPGSSAETSSMVERQLAGLISEPLDGFVRRILPLGQSPVDGRTRAFALCTLMPVADVEEVTGTLARAGLVATALFTLPAALMAAEEGSRADGVVAWVHIDRGAGTIAYFDHGQLRGCVEIRYDVTLGEEGGVQVDPAMVAAEIQRALNQYRLGNAAQTVSTVRLTGWDATRDVFEALADNATGMTVEAVPAPPVDLSRLTSGSDLVEGFLYAQALLVWCGLRRAPVNLVPRGALRPARLRRAAVTAGAVAGAYLMVLLAGGIVLARDRHAVDQELAALGAASARLPIDQRLEQAQSAGQRRLALLGQMQRPTPDIAAFFSALGLAAGDRTFLTALGVARDGAQVRGQITGLSLGVDAAAAQGEFQRFAAALRARSPAGAVSVGELKLQNEISDNADVALFFEVVVTLGVKEGP
jgi:hypothetical protein